MVLKMKQKNICKIFSRKGWGHTMSVIFQTLVLCCNFVMTLFHGNFVMGSFALVYSFSIVLILCHATGFLKILILFQISHKTMLLRRLLGQKMVIFTPGLVNRVLQKVYATIFNFFLTFSAREGPNLALFAKKRAS